MRRRIRALSERNWRVIDRLFAAFLACVAVLDLTANSQREGPLWLNLTIMVGIAVSFVWRRSHPLPVAAVTLGGLLVMASWLTEPPDMFAAVLALTSAGGAASTGPSPAASR